MFQAITSYDGIDYLMENLKNKPKLMIDALLDEFFIPDALNMMWNEVLGEKHVHFENDDHSLSKSVPDVFENILSFFNSVRTGASRPNFDWSVMYTGENFGRIGGTVNGATPSKVNLMTATSSTNRDWRLYTCSDLSKCLNPNANFVSSPLNITSDGTIDFGAQVSAICFENFGFFFFFFFFFQKGTREGLCCLYS